ncbi:MAG: hypothetical protein HRT70_07975 [Flavobacteriaceae bacterium]|nr:hypothetical protein [Flavobacteriaceae bacterium]
MKTSYKWVTLVKTTWNDPATNTQFDIPAGTPCYLLEFDYIPSDMTIEEISGFRRQKKRSPNLKIIKLQGKYRAIEPELIGRKDVLNKRS